MSQFSLTTPVRHFYRNLIYRTGIEYNQKNLERSTIFFAPHQDDETLGCGGTIIRKKQAGADVKIVFMTDGSQSHAHLMPPNQLKLIRAKEAIAAAKKMGVSEEDVIFLEVKDGTLEQNFDSTMEKVTEIFFKFLPEEIFIPYSQDGVSDHNATNQIVLSALKGCQASVTIYEYPVWYWNHLPWTSFGGAWTNLGGSPKKILSDLKNSVIADFNLLYKFKYFVDIEQVLTTKIAAINEHKSQMTQLNNHPKWLTLGDVSNGEFIECFLQKKEIFYRYHLIMGEVKNK
ncbi:MAG: PIG-L family deacetylase [Nostocaceae cyanobacterium]|nr:PIG-L family deacetylase [Nostocaceae cyanobacterium]